MSYKNIIINGSSSKNTHYKGEKSYLRRFSPISQSYVS